MPDREKIINAIEKAKKKSEEYAQDRIIVPFKEVDMIIALLKEQDAVVRCKDCAMSHPWNDDVVQCRNKKISSTYVQKDWFCADGVKAE